MTGDMLGLGPCWGCKQIFAFDPDRVPSVYIDPVTQRPPDQGGDPYRALREPVCPSCCEIVNPFRAARGLPPLEESPA